MSKASPESISEFIKYATPRLEYLAGMEPGQMEKMAMEKQAYQFLSRIAKGAIKNPAQLRALLNQTARAGGADAAKAQRYLKLFGNNDAGMQRMMERVSKQLAPANKMMPAAPVGPSLAPVVPGAAASAAPQAGGVGKTLQGYLDRVRGGIQKNPLAFTAGAGFAGTALGDQLGYGRGNSAGQEQGADVASQYYNTLINQYKQNYNNDTSGILSRIGNVFAPTSADTIFSLPK